MKPQKTWRYRGVKIYRSDINATGIRWYSIQPHLRADTKEGMRRLLRKMLCAN